MSSPSPVNICAYYLHQALSIALAPSSAVEEVPGVTKEEFQKATKLFVYWNLEKFLKLLKELHERDTNYVFRPVGEVSIALYNFLENSQPLQLQIWYEIWEHPSMNFFQIHFMLKLKELQEKMITDLKVAIIENHLVNL